MKNLSITTRQNVIDVPKTIRKRFMNRIKTNELVFSTNTFNFGLLIPIRFIKNLPKVNNPFHDLKKEYRKQIESASKRYDDSITINTIVDILEIKQLSKNAKQLVRI